MTKTKHPQTRADRIKLREKKDKIKEPGAGKIRRQAKNYVREKEAADEITLEVNHQ